MATNSYAYIWLRVPMTIYGYEFTCLFMATNSYAYIWLRIHINIYGYESVLLHIIIAMNTLDCIYKG